MQPLSAAVKKTCGSTTRSLRSVTVCFWLCFSVMRYVLLYCHGNQYTGKPRARELRGIELDFVAAICRNVLHDVREQNPIAALHLIHGEVRIHLLRFQLILGLRAELRHDGVRLREFERAFEEFGAGHWERLERRTAGYFTIASCPVTRRSRVTRSSVSPRRTASKTRTRSSTRPTTRRPTSHARTPAFSSPAMSSSFHRASCCSTPPPSTHRTSSKSRARKRGFVSS